VVLAALAVGGTHGHRRAATGTVGALVLAQVLFFAVKPKAAPFVLYELSACVWLGLAAFVALAGIALGSEDGQRPNEDRADDSKADGRPAPSPARAPTGSA